VGIAFDGSELLVSCTENNVITRVDPMNGNNLGSYTISGLDGIPAGTRGSDNSIGAISWDASVPMGQLWIATANGSENVYRIPGTTLNKTLGTGVATPAFHHALNGSQPGSVTPYPIIDGIAFDGTGVTPSIWLSPDVSYTVFQYTETGVLLGSHDVNGKLGTCSYGNCGNSGVLVADPKTLYLANDGGSQIYSADKPNIASTTLFATVSGFRLEDMECDNVDFAPKGALWSKDAFDFTLRAFEVPAGQCAQGGVADQAIVASGTSFTATEGKPFVGQKVASFCDPDPMSTAAEYNAIIDWGDTTSSPPPPVNIVPTGPGPCGSGTGQTFDVTGDHTYTEENTYTLAVTITDVDTPSNTKTVKSFARVSDAAIHATCAAAPVSTQSFSGSTARFTDDNSFATSADFSATIAWGDASSSPPPPVTISGGPGSGPYTVKGTHTYSSTGLFTITTTITDDGGATDTTSCKVFIGAFPTGNGATFVVGDLEATGPGAQLTWWSSQWAKINQMSGGPAPASMKGFSGFEDMPLPSPLPPLNALCGMTWTTDTGNATPPPQTVPDDMFVIVSSHITQNGSVISGDIKELILVHNNPGYAPDPGHTGTGTEVILAC
jgi:hypothetical protein